MIISFLLFLMHRKIELDLLRKIRIPDGPTLFPVVNTPWKNKEHEAVDFDKLIEKRLV